MPDPFKPSLKPFTDSEYSSAPTAAPPLPVPGFWLRTAAFAVDVGLLSLVYSTVGRRAYEALYPARAFTQPLGALVVFLYFLIGNSPLTKGQTAGKALLGIRTLSLGGGGPDLDWGTALKRAALLQLYVFAYLFAIFPFFAVIGVLILRARMPFTFLAFPIGAENWLGMMTLGGAATGFAFCNAVFCGLHPKRTGFHDLLTQTAVVRKGEEAAALAFLSQWDDVDRTRQKLAKWPAGTLALVVLTGWAWITIPGWQAKSQGPVSRAREILKSKNFELMAIVGPSAEDARHFDQSLRAENETRAAKGLDPLTTESLRMMWDGRKMYFLFLDKTLLTSETLAALPDYAELFSELPPLARELRDEFFRDKNGERTPYAQIQIEFVEILPLYLYSRSRRVWTELIPAKEGQKAEKEPTRVQENQGRQEQQGQQE